MRKTSIGSLRKTLRFCHRLQQSPGVLATRDRPAIQHWRGFAAFRTAEKLLRRPKVSAEVD